MMRQIVEWLPAALPFIVIGMLLWTVAVQNIRIKRLSYERYRTMELIRGKMGMAPILWRGSIAKYNEDIDKHEALKHKWVTKRQGGHPAEAGSYERVCFCEVCGDELNDDNRDSECGPPAKADVPDSQ